MAPIRSKSANASKSCPHCRTSFPNAAAVHKHIAHTRTCSQADSNAFQRLMGQLLPKQTQSSRSVPSSSDGDVHPPGCMEDVMEINGNSDDGLMDIDNIPQSNPQPTSPRRPYVEEVPDEDPFVSPLAAQTRDSRQRVIVEFPADRKAGEPIAPGKTRFQVIQDEQSARNTSRWGKFRDREAYETCEWLVKTTGQGDADDFLHLGFVRDASCRAQAFFISHHTVQIRNHNPPLPFKNKNTLYSAVDDLPLPGSEWTCHIIDISGDKADDEGNPIAENVELWMRDIIECIRELLGNPAFRRHLCFKPEQAYRDATRTRRIFDQTWTGDWAWEMQVCLTRHLSM
jgi:hypothetical protein